MLFDLLTDREKDMIDWMRKSVAEDAMSSDFATEREFMPVKDWLRFWNVNKEHMAPVFKDSLILKKEISFQKSQDEMRNEIEKDFMGSFENFLSRIAYKLSPYNDILMGDPDNVYYKADTKFFLCHEEHDEWSSKPYYSWYTIEQFLRYRFCTTNQIMTNTYNDIEVEINLPDNKKYRLSKGAKMMRVVGRLAKAVDMYEEFETLRLDHSRILNEVNHYGTLCLSIHPLDFMTASYNNNDWRSCMEWWDGEFRRGVIEMMNSRWVVCAYLESSHEDITLGSSHWNSKKWREFFIVDEELISAIKGYPYWNHDLEEIVLDWLVELFAPVNGEYDNKSYHYTSVGSNDSGVIKSSDETTILYRVYFETGSAMYNDFYGDNEYLVRAKLNLGQITTPTYINYSGESECVWCGDYQNEFETESALVCDGCEVPYYCTECGSRITSREDMYEVDGEIYCRDCYENMPNCDICGEIFNLENSEAGNFCVGYDAENEDTVYHDYYGNTIEFCICPSCTRELFKKKEDFWKLADSRETVCHFWRRIPLFNPDEFEDDAFDKLNINKEDIEEMESAYLEDMTKQVEQEILKDSLISAVDISIPTSF